MDHERDGGRHVDVDEDDLHSFLRSEDLCLECRRLEDDEGEEDLIKALISSILASCSYLCAESFLSM